MVPGFSKPPPSATRPPLRVLKPLENHGFPVNSQNAVGAVGAADSGSRRYKKANSAFPLWASAAALIGPFIYVAYAAIVIALAAMLAASDLRPHPGDHNTINGRSLFPPAHEVLP